MLAFILKIIIGFVFGLLAGSLGGSGFWAIFPFALLWGLGMTFAIQSHLRWLGSIMRTATWLSIISFLSCGSGFLGLLLLFAVLVFNLTLGWLYGVYLLIVDIVTLIRYGSL